MSGVAQLTESSSVIIGDNLTVLPWIATTMAAQFKCVYLDPPYNDGSQVFYDPVVDSDAWLHDLALHLEAIKKCLRPDGGSR